MTFNLALPDRQIGDDLVKSAAYLTINQLDTHYHIDHLSQAIADIVDLGDQSKWATGDLLLFGRMRMTRELVYAESDDHPNPDLLTQAMSYAFKQFGSRARPLGTVKLISWNVHLYDQFWILEHLDSLDVRIWVETQAAEPTEMGFNDYMKSIASDFANWKTLGNRYRTSAVFHRDLRRADLPWSLHFNLGNLAGGGIDASSKGILRIGEKSQAVQTIMDKLEEGGPITLGRVYELQREQKENQDGYKFLPPWVPNLIVEDTHSGEEHIAIEFADIAQPETLDPEVFYAQCKVIQAAGIFAAIGKSCPMYLRDDDLLMEDGRLIGTLKNTEEEAVRRALDRLASNLNWQIYDETVGRHYEWHKRNSR